MFQMNRIGIVEKQGTAVAGHASRHIQKGHEAYGEI